MSHRSNQRERGIANGDFIMLANRLNTEHEASAHASTRTFPHTHVLCELPCAIDTAEPVGPVPTTASQGTFVPYPARPRHYRPPVRTAICPCRMPKPRNAIIIHASFVPPCLTTVSSCSSCGPSKFAEVVCIAVDAAGAFASIDSPLPCGIDLPLLTVDASGEPCQVSVV